MDNKRQHPIERAIAAAALGDRPSYAQLGEIRDVFGADVAQQTDFAVNRVLRSIAPNEQANTNAIAARETAAIMTDELRDAWKPPYSERTLPG
jgi:hypothetical protein